jgi:hypothetical protein
MTGERGAVDASANARRLLHDGQEPEGRNQRQTAKQFALASAILSEAGVVRAANVAGGMVRWRELGLPSEAGRRDVAGQPPSR